MIMKNKSIKEQILEITGMSEGDFYNAFPTMDKALQSAKYGKKIEKLLNGGAVKKAQTGWQDNFAPAPLEMETYNFDKNQRKINRDAEQVRKQNLKQGVGIIEPQKNFDLGIDSEDVKAGTQYTGAVGQNFQKVSGAIAAKKAEKDKFKLLTELSPLIAQANSSMRERPERNYLRPDDPNFLIQPDTLHNPLGSGPGLYAKNGTEIANTFAPNTIYTDLEQAATGAEMALISEGINTVGDQAAFFFDMGRKKYQKKNEQLIGQMGMQPGIQNINSQYVSHMERGGFVNPQVATSLEGIPMKRLFAPDPTMDTLRTGGHIRQNNITAMDGNIKATWGGQLKTISYNPYQAGSGQTALGFGNYHDEKDEKGRTGIGLSVGNKNSNPMMDYAEYGTKAAEMNSNVEFEPEEPIIEQANPEGGTSVVVLGNQKLTRETAKIMGDPKLAGKKINKVGLDIALLERNINDKMQKSAAFLSELNANNPYDKLTQSALQASFKGYDMKLKKLADDKLKLTAIQDVTNQIDKEGKGYDYEQLFDEGILENKTNKAKMGAKITTADKGKEFNLTGETVIKEDYDKAMKLYESGKIKEFQQLGMKLMPEFVKSLGTPTISGKFDDGIDKKRTKALAQQMSKSVRDSLPDMKDFKVDLPNMPNTGTVGDAANTALDYFRTADDQSFQENYPEGKSKTDRFGIARSIYNQFRPFILPSNAEGLDFAQVAPEYMALAENQVEPVQAQKVPLRLMNPQQVSYADQLAQLQSDFRAGQRMMQGNPAAQSILAAQKAKQSTEVLANEFRANQAMRDAVQTANLDEMRKNDMANLGLLDQQYVRQQQAISNTRAVKQAALNSINAKILENRLSNRQLQMYENSYGYRFDKQGRAINVNPLAEFNIEGSGGEYGTSGVGGMGLEDLEYLVAKKKYEEKQQKRFMKDSKNARNGTIVSSAKLTNYK